MGLFIRVICVLFFIGLAKPSAIFAQDNGAHETEKKLVKAAAEYFEQEDFTQAAPLYSQLLSLYPRDPNYNYRYGTCLLFTQADKSKALKYLQFSIKQSSVENLAYYYLGRAMHLNYRFNQAEYYYEKFGKMASTAELKKYPVTHLIEMCNNAKELLSKLHGLDVLRKRQLGTANYIAGYDMHGNRGALIFEPDEFKTKLDKQKKLNSLMYLTPDKSQAFFSSYGNVEKTGKDIYVVKRKFDGTWGTPENIGTVINTSFDEDYPVYDVPRHTLYFSSKGHNSMGGYDIFESVYKDSSKTWSEPVNLDFPINTPDDDILFVPDTSGETAFFSSTRSSPQGTIDVYKIIPHLHPPESVVVEGTLYGDDKIPITCKITVQDTKTNKIIQAYTADGKYSFNLPNGGSYNFIIETSNHKPQSKLLVLPVEETSEAIKEDIKFDSSGTVQIKNVPEEMSNDSDSQIAVNYIQHQAQMDVNIDTNSMQNLVAKNQSGTPNTKPQDKMSNGNTNSSGATNTESDVQLAQEEQQLNTKAAKAMDFAGDKMEEAEQMEAQAKGILSHSGENADSVTTAQNLLSQSKISEEEGMEAYQLASEYKSGATQMEMNKNKQATGNNSEAPTVRLSPGDLIRMQAQQVKEDSFQVISTNAQLTQDITALQQVSQNYIIQAGQTNDSQKKIALLQQADDLSKSKEEKKQELKENNGQLQQLHEEYTWLNSKAIKADSMYTASANKGGRANNTNSISQDVLQQEINAYTSTYSYNEDSTANTNDSAYLSKTIATKNSKYRHSKGVTRTSQASNITTTPDTTASPVIAANNPTSNSSTTNSTIESQTQVANTNTIAPIATASPVVTPSTANSTSDQNAQVANTNASAPSTTTSTSDNQNPQIANTNTTTPATTTNPVVATTTTTNSTSDNQNIQAANTNTTAPVATTNPVVTPSSTNTTSDNQNPQIANTNTTTPATTTNPVVATTTTTNTTSDNQTQVANTNTTTPATTTNPVVATTTNSTSDNQTQVANTNTTAPATTTSADVTLPNLQAANTNTTTPMSPIVTPSTTTSTSDNQNIQAANTNTTAPVATTNPVVATTTNSTSDNQTQVANTNTTTPATTTNPVVATTNSTSDNQSTQVANTNTTTPVASADNPPPVNSSITNSTSDNQSTQVANTNTTTPVVDNNNSAATSTNNNSTSENQSVEAGSIQKNATIFTEPHRSAYSASKPIPMDPPLPTGLIFNIQVGAFRNPIPQDLFRGFEPVIALKGKDGFIRYSTGLYDSFDTAKIVLRKVRSLGYPDAFIIAFYNGKRISMAEALAKLGSSPAIATTGQNNGNGSNVTTNDNSQAANNVSLPNSGEEVAIAENTIAPSKNALINERRRDQKAIKDTVPPDATSMATIKGLVYTVQVGSFSKRKGFIRLRKIKQLYTWTDDNGTVKYNSGTYSSVADAQAARDIIRANTSVKDAFVTAYYNGKRVNPALYKGKISSANTIVSQGAETKNNSDSTEENNPFSIVSKMNVIYSVQIASYTGELPVDEANKILKYASEGIIPYKQETGVTAYYAGTFNDYKSAEKLQKKFLKEGFQNAFIVAYYHGKRISFEEAQAIINK